MKAMRYGKTIEIDTSNLEYSDDLYQKAYDLSRHYFSHSSFMGVKIVGKYMYVKGGDDGFPHTRDYLKIDLSNDSVVEVFGADCPVKVGEEFAKYNLD